MPLLSWMSWDLISSGFSEVHARNCKAVRRDRLPKYPDEDTSE